MYYRTRRGQNACAPNKLRFPSLAGVLAFDAFRLADGLPIQPIQIVTGSVPGGFGLMQEDRGLFERITGEKDLFVVEGATRYDLYDRPVLVAKVVTGYRAHVQLWASR